MMSLPQQGHSFQTGTGIPSSSSDQSSNSPNGLQLPATPDMLAMGTGLPASWAAWTDPEALLISYLSSGIDLNVAEMAAYAGVPDPSAFLWPGMSSSNSPDNPQQTEPVIDPEPPSPSKDDMALLSPNSAIEFLFANGIEPSPFASGAPGGDQIPQAPVDQSLDNMTAWDPRQWPGQQAFY